MYTKPNNLKLPISRTRPAPGADTVGPLPWSGRFSYWTAPTFKKLAYVGDGYGYGSRIPPAPVIGNPLSKIRAEHFYGSDIQSGLGGPETGLSGFFDDAGSFFKKGFRYTGATVVSPWVSAGTSRKMFGLSARESRQFETYAKVSRGITIAAATAGVALNAPSALARIRAARASKIAGAATKPAGKGFFGGFGAKVGQTALWATVLGKKAGQPINMISEAGKEFQKEYEKASGQKMPIAEMKKLGDKVNDLVQAQVAARSNLVPLQTGPFPGPQGVAQDYYTPMQAGFGNVMQYLPLISALAIGGLIFSKVVFPKKYRRMRRA